MNDDDAGLADRVRDAYRRARLDTEAERARLLERLRREPAPGRPPAASRIARWIFVWTRPPALAVAALVVVFAAGAWTGWSIATRPAPPSAGPRPMAAGGGVAVVFALPAPEASRVALVGDFNGWDAETTPLRRAALGNIWTVEVRLPEGVHTYAFVIDGTRWVPDPAAPLASASEPGSRNSVVIVGEVGPS